MRKKVNLIIFSTVDSLLIKKYKKKLFQPCAPNVIFFIKLNFYGKIVNLINFSQPEHKLKKFKFAKIFQCQPCVHIKHPILFSPI